MPRLSIVTRLEPEEIVRLAVEARFSPRAFAQLCGISLRTLERDFRKHLGYSPENVFGKLRLRIALGASQASARTKEVAYNAGYKQVSHFCHRVKIDYGQSFKDWRRHKGRNLFTATVV